MTKTMLGTVLLTGGSGSFGRSFVAHALAHGLVDRLVSVSRNAEMRYRLEQDCPDPRLIVAPGDVRILEDLEAAYDGPIDTIIHAAAEKHVPTGEKHEHYVRSINVGGALNIIRFARLRRVSRVLALSTDKACNPINAYGRSKAEAERLFVSANHDGDPRFACVRYGNVVGSSGSVLPLFIKQQKAGKLTVTSKSMSRFHMALSPTASAQVYQEPGRRRVMSAVELVLYALEHMAGGELFIPMIPSSTIGDLAAAFSGCAIEEIGVRPGEKIHEELIHSSESDRCWKTKDGVFVIMPTVSAIPAVFSVPVEKGFAYTSADDPQPLVLEMEARR